MRFNRLFFLVLLVLSAILLRSCYSPYTEKNLVFTREFIRTLSGNGSLSFSDAVPSNTHSVCVFGEYGVFPKDHENNPGFGQVPNSEKVWVGEYENIFHYFDDDGRSLGQDNMLSGTVGASPGLNGPWDDEPDLKRFYGCAPPEQLFFVYEETRRFHFQRRLKFRVMKRTTPQNRSSKCTEEYSQSSGRSTNPCFTGFIQQ